MCLITRRHSFLILTYQLVCKQGIKNIGGNNMGMAVKKEEIEYRFRIDQFQDVGFKADQSSPVEGFEYFDSKAYQPLEANKVKKDEFTKFSFNNKIRKPLTVFRKHLVKIMKSQKDSFAALEPYFQEIEKSGRLLSPEISLMSSFPNSELWEELVSLIWDKYKVKIGFTEVPDKLIYKKKKILFKYAIVCIQEMDETMMSKAPSVDASDVVVGVYKTLGIAVNEIARWLRKNYEVRCQSNHPLGGLVNTSPLAAKAGMGWQGHNGLLITPWFGQRHRIAPIFIEEPIFEFTDNLDHTWIESFCKTCRKCEKMCPAGAIFPEKIVAQDNVPGIGQVKTCISKEKCYPYFSATLGCGKCVAVCPFSKGSNNYYKLKIIIDRKNKPKNI